MHLSFHPACTDLHTVFVEYKPNVLMYSKRFPKEPWEKEKKSAVWRSYWGIPCSFLGDCMCNFVDRPMSLDSTSIVEFPVHLRIRRMVFVCVIALHSMFYWYSTAYWTQYVHIQGNEKIFSEIKITGGDYHARSFRQCIAYINVMYTVYGVHRYVLWRQYVLQTRWSIVLLL